MTDVVVIGGGVIGMLTAREFALNGANVKLLERKSIGCEASWAGGGILSPLYPWRQANAITVLCRWSQNQYPELVDSLAVATGIDLELAKTGILITDDPCGGETENWCQVNSVEFSRLSEENIQNFGSGLHCSAENPIYLPDVAHLRNPRLLKALSMSLEQTGVKILEGCRVLGLVVEKQHIHCLKTHQGRVFGDQFVLAAGAWTPQIGAGLLTGCQVEPIKGQMILFKTEPDILSTIVVDHGRYFIPRKDGRILVGSTVEKSGFDRSTTEVGRTELEEFAYSRLPTLKKFPLEKHWAGLRPGTPSGMPYIGVHPVINNLTVNCGHFRNGFAMGPASARLLADLVLKRDPIVCADPYSLDREESDH